MNGLIWKSGTLLVTFIHKWILQSWRSFRVSHQIRQSEISVPILLTDHHPKFACAKNESRKRNTLDLQLTDT